jgi:23S rRNA (uridine2552-2'-O)-methyltransferase
MNNDYYFKKAKEEGYPARSVYKLKELDKKYKILRKGDKVLDLGSAPGSWLLYAAEKVGDRGQVIGIDKKELKIPLKENTYFIKVDVWKLNLLELKEEFDNFDVVLSDLAPATSGVSFLDAEKSMELCWRAFEIAKSLLKENANFVVKVFENEELNKFFQEIKKHFNFAKRVRPSATKKGSREIFIVAKNFKRNF